VWTELGKKWYTTELVNGRIKKIIPGDLKLTPLSLAVWYMDDGVNSSKDAQAKLCTNGFNNEEVIFLSEIMKRDLGIEGVKCRVKKHKEQFVIRINRKQYFEFIEMIKPEVKWDCFQYKLDTSLYIKKDNKGINHGLSKLNDDQAKEIYTLRQQGVPRKEVAARFNVTETCVTQIATGQHWKHLGHPEVRRQKKLTQEDRKYAKELLSKGMEQHEVAKLIGTSQSSISRLASGKTFKVAA
jgi:ribosome-binding protein aMBF1 (putative translation factor)